MESKIGKSKFPALANINRKSKSTPASSSGTPNLDGNTVKSETSISNGPKPFVLAKCAHTRSMDGQHEISECKRVLKGALGKRTASFEMKVNNYSMDYVGEMVKQDKRAGVEWVVAVRNRRTGKTVFAPFQMVNFRPYIEIPEELKNYTTKVDASNYEEMRRRVIMEFGSKKQQQQINSGLRNILDEKSTGQLYSNAMEYMKKHDDTKRAKLDNEEEQGNGDGEPSKSVQLSTALPPCNLQAKSPSEMYKLSDIVSDDILDIMKGEAEAYLLLTPGEAKEEGHPSLVLAVIQMTASIKDLEERTNRVAYALYLSYLIRLNRLIGGPQRSIEPSSITRAFRMPYEIQTDLLMKFTSAGGIGKERRRSVLSASKLSITPLHKDGLLARISVLLLILSGQYAFNINKAAQDLGLSDRRVSMPKFTSICKALGCKMEKHPRSGEQVAILNEPPKQRTPAFLRERGGRR